ncbi:carboxypeptidase-like regulatory domain-containing protein [Plantactinospora soyae]|uniref:alpha-amylase n=1 Tax=Plantactinospora soyae TaxID=1544732 RepID=A0A927M8H2_9ACTN|nr:carboxypeptidase-like regulatory domain-containing protein [Plantactinospora soyae]MBE1489909.1 5-hydroxyisourate hydrolase-like protein (transthyretin family) [Plantactinospora soyae]
MTFVRLRRAALSGAVLGALVLSAAPPALAAAPTGSITGQVTTAAGQPAADTTVALYSGGENLRDFIGTTVTEPDGSYRFGGLKTAPYVLSFTPSGGPEQFYHRKSDLGAADDIAVTDGVATTVDEQLLASGTITGQIRDAAGTGVPDLLLSFTRHDESGFSYRLTDADGRYTVAVLPGTYTVSFRPLADSNQQQFVPGRLDEEEAKRFEVPADGEVVADDTVLGTGSLAGRLSTAAGTPAVGADVSLYSFRGNPAGNASTDSAGDFNITGLLAGSYQLSYYHGGLSQYYKGKLAPEQADPVVVTAGEETRVSDSLLATGSVRITAVDAVTGSIIGRFCVEDWCSNGTGRVTIPNRPTVPQQFRVYTDSPTYLMTDTEWITPVPNQTVNITVALHRAARVTATVLDRETRLPLRGVCVTALSVRDPRLPDGHGDCSNSAGVMTLGALKAGSYHLFADPIDDRSYGRQWVGPSGGTGDQRSAATVVAVAGTTVAGPTVLLDRAGAIGGRVTNETGAPVADVRVNLLGYQPGSGPPDDIVTDSDGRYEVTGLGPYAWPLLFQQDGFGQWSGGVANRHDATPVTVTAGGTSGYDLALRPGIELRGTVRSQDGRPLGGGHLMVHNTGTGDIISFTSIGNGAFSLPVLPNQSVQLSYGISDGGRYLSGPYVPCSGTEPAVFALPETGPFTIDMVICTR